MSDFAVAFEAAGARVESLGQALVERFGALNLLTAMLLAGALVLDRALSRRARASLRIALYAPVGLRILLPLDWNIGLASAPQAATIFQPLLQIAAPPDIAPSPSRALSWYALAAVVYVAIATLLAARAIHARLRLSHVLADARPLPDLDPGVPCPVVEHDDLGPMAVGLFAPRVVLPRNLLVAGEQHALSCVLRHEAAHLRRRDAWLSAAMQLFAVAAWPVVPLWIAMARVRQLMELACDEAAVAGADAVERRRYGHALLDMAEWRSLGTAAFGAGELHFGSTLRARIEALASQRHWPLGAQAVALALTSVALFLACSGAAPSPPAPPGLDAKGYGYEFKTETTKDVTEAPTWAIDAPFTNPEGRLLPEPIQDNVRAHFGAILNCYEIGRRRDSKLSGIVTVKYMIGEDGVPKSVDDWNSTLPDKEVIGCVLGVFRKLRFRESHDGNVNVVYPIQLGAT